MKILFITSTRIGDTVMTMGLLSHLADKHPNASFTIACGPLSIPLFRAFPNLEQVIPLRKRPYDLHWVELWAKCISHHWDLVVDMRSSFISWFLFARERHVFRFWHCSESRHKVEQHGLVLGLQEAPDPKIWTAEEDHDRAAELIPSGRPVLALGPTTSWEGKQWPIPRYVELVKRLIAPGGIFANARVAILATAKERKIVQPIIDILPEGDFLDIIGKGDLLTAAACLKRCNFVIANDTGLMHLAAATGTPTLGLFGPSLKANYAPWGKCTGVAETTIPAQELIQQIGQTDETLMGSLTVEATEMAARELWQRCAKDCLNESPNAPSPPLRVVESS